MLRRLRNRFNQRRLKDPRYGFLFDEPVNDELVCFDCETSGLDLRNNELLSLAAVKIRGGRILTSERLQLKLRPAAGVDAESIRIHQLRNVDMAGGLPPREAMERFLHFIGPRPLVGYYLEFDVAMVNKLIRPWLGIRLPNRCIEVSALYYDHKIGRIPQQNVDLRFDTIMKELNLPLLGQHDAFNDALMTAMIYVKLQHAARR